MSPESPFPEKRASNILSVANGCSPLRKQALPLERAGPGTVVAALSLLGGYNFAREIAESSGAGSLGRKICRQHAAQFRPTFESLG
jgi:hypothetical protein